MDETEGLAFWNSMLERPVAEWNEQDVSKGLIVGIPSDLRGAAWIRLSERLRNEAIIVASPASEDGDDEGLISKETPTDNNVGMPASSRQSSTEVQIIITDASHQTVSFESFDTSFTNSVNSAVASPGRPTEGRVVYTDPLPYVELLVEPCIYRHAIKIDVGRTFPEHPIFLEKWGSGQQALFNCMRAYSIADPELGYCQGLSFVAGLLLMHVRM